MISAGCWAETAIAGAVASLIPADSEIRFIATWSAARHEQTFHTGERNALSRAAGSVARMGA